MNSVETNKVEINAIHDINSTGLDDQFVEDIDIVNISGGGEAFYFVVAVVSFDAFNKLVVRDKIHQL